MKVLSCGPGKPGFRNTWLRSRNVRIMPIPRIQPLLLPVLRIISEKSERSVEEIRTRVKGELNLTAKEMRQVHPASGINVFVNRVAWALAHLVMGDAIKLGKEGTYRITGHGLAILNEKPSELTIKDLH